METYTFSRALHMMRYNGAKMKCVTWDDSMYAIVEDGKLWQYTGLQAIDAFIAEDIMNSWIEVK